MKFMTQATKITMFQIILLAFLLFIALQLVYFVVIIN